MNSQELNEKLNRYLALLQQDEQNLSLLLEVSLLHAELNQIKEAQAYLDKAKVIDETACFTPQGLLYIKQERPKQALEHFLHALTVSNSDELRYYLGVSYYLTGDLTHAKEALLVIKDPEYMRLTWFLLARIFQQENNLEDAIYYLEKHTKEAPEDAEAMGFLSLLYFDNNNAPLAKEFSKKALNIDNSIYDARLTDILIRLMTQETEIDEIHQLLEVNPDDSRLWFALGSTYMIKGEFEPAAKYLENTLKIHPEFYDCHIALAWCQLLNDELSKAHETYQNAVALTDSLADGWGGLALIHALNADLEQAKQLINKAYSLNEDCFLTQMAEVIYLTHKNPTKAQQQLFNTLTNQTCAASQKIALLMEHMI